MNLNHNPTMDELKQLFASQDDEAGDHCLWIDESGEVHLSLIPEDLGPVGFMESQPTLVRRYETFDQGNDYVGIKASQDDALMPKIYESLLKEWQKVAKGKGSTYIDSF